MSAIQKELTALGMKFGTDRQASLRDAIVAIHKLDDDAFYALSKPAQNWFNVAAEDVNQDKPEVTELPDYKEEAAPPPATRRRAAEPAAAPAAPKTTLTQPAKIEKGAIVQGVTGRGSAIEGKYVETEGDLFILDDGEGEIEFNYVKAQSWGVVTEVAAEAPAAGRRRRAADEDDGEPAGPKDPAVGDEVTLINARDKEYTGKIIEMNDEIVVLDLGAAGEMEFNRDRIKSIKVAGAAPAPAAEGGRRRAAAAPAAAADDGKPKRSSNPAGVSVGQRIREIMCEATDITEEDVGKQLTKEGLEFRPPTLKMIYKDTKSTFELLKAAKRLK